MTRRCASKDRLVTPGSGAAAADTRVCGAGQARCGGSVGDSHRCSSRGFAHASLLGACREQTGSSGASGGRHSILNFLSRPDKAGDHHDDLARGATQIRPCPLAEKHHLGLGQPPARVESIPACGSVALLSWKQSSYVTFGLAQFGMVHALYLTNHSCVF